MSQLTDAADTIRQHIKVLEALKTASDALYGLDAIDNAANEANVRRQTAEQRANDAQNNLNALNDKARAQAAEIEQNAAQVAQANAEAQASREAALANAKAKAEAILEQAKNDGEQIKTHARISVAGAQKDALDAQTARDKALEEHAAIKVNIDQAQAELAVWTAKIEEAKAKIQAMLA